MNRKQIKLAIVVTSIIVFAISLTQNAFTAKLAESNGMSSLECFLTGSIAFLGGGIAEQFVWFANPLLLISIYFLWNDNRKAILISLASFLIALSFMLWDEVLKSESGATTKILSLELGYYLWIASIGILLIGNFFYFRIMLVFDNIKPLDKSVLNKRV